jgi:outer membrane receptor protein involved in Fe transport
MRLSVFASVVIVFLADPSSASAQASGAAQQQGSVQNRDGPIFHTEIVVTPERRPEVRSRIPAATAVLTSTEVERRPAETLPEVLELLPGVHVLFDQAVGAMPMVSSRGFFGAGEADYVQLLINGVPAADVESGVADWASMQAAEIERIEALRGPGSSLYGDTAMGGVVQIFTRQPLGRGRASVAAGSSETLLASAGHHASIRNVGLGLSGSGLRTSGFRANSAARQGSLHASVGWPASDSRWGVEVYALSRQRREPGPLTVAELDVDRFASHSMFRFDREDTDKARAAITYRRTAGSSQYQLRVHAQNRETERVRTLLLAAGVGDRSLRGISTLATTFSGEAGTTVELIGETELQINSGLEISQERLDTNYQPVSNSGVIDQRTALLEARRQRAGGFGSLGWAVSNRVRISSGLRWDYITDRVRDADQGLSHVAWSPRMGVNVLAGPIDGRPLSVFVQTARAFKAPTVDQLFDPHPFPDFRGGTFQISSDTLEPQRAWNIEAGISQSLARLRWDIVAYRMTVRNEIDFDPLTFRYGNIGRSRHSGVEVGSRFGDAGPISAGFLYTWTRVTPLGGPAQGLQLKNVPAHLARSEVTVTLPHTSSIHVRHTVTAGRHLDDEHEFPLRNSSIVDLRIETRVARSRFTFDALNVTNARLEELGFALPSPLGRHVAYYYPGVGFAARAGFAIEF